MKKGFTLIEMAVVLLIIGILSTVVIRNIGGQTVMARDQRRIADLRTVSTYLANYLAKYGAFPTSNTWSDLQTAIANAGISPTLPNDPLAGASYSYFYCTDLGTGGQINHFILRARLEQSQTQAPKLYETSYNSGTPPPGWTCSPSGFDCQAANNRYYCAIQ